MSRDKMTVKIKGKKGEINQVKTINAVKACALIASGQATLVAGVDKEVPKYKVGPMREAMNKAGRSRK